MKQSRAI